MQGLVKGETLNYPSPNNLPIMAIPPPHFPLQFLLNAAHERCVEISGEKRAKRSHKDTIYNIQNTRYK